MKNLCSFSYVKTSPKLHYASLVGAFITAASSLWLEQQDWTQHDILQLGWLTIAQYSLLAVCMLVSWFTGPKTNRIADYKWLIITAIAIRILLMPVEPYSSNDIDRYLFDGKLAISGFDPYRTSHDAKALAELREEWSPPAEHAQYVTLYPPVALGLFSLAASAGVTYAAILWKVLVTVASIAIIPLMLGVLKRYGKLRHFPLVALSPLLVLESGAGAHIDVFSALAVCAALYFWTGKQFLYAGIAIGLGALSKMLPILLLMPLAISSLPKLKQGSALVLGTLATLIAGYGGAFLLGLHPVGSISLFFQKWRNGSPLFDFFQDNIATPNILPSVIIFAFISMLLIAAFTWKNKDNPENFMLNAKALQWTLIIPLLISPVVFPWYLMPLVPLFALSPNMFLLLWFTLFPLSYEVQNQFACCNIWEPASWPMTLLGAGMLVGLFFDRIFVSSPQTGTKHYAQAA